MIPVIKSVSDQASEVYKLLGDGQAMTARQIGRELDILPNAVYRVADRLVDMGMVEKLDGYPARFKALPSQAALNHYMLIASQSFRREFGFNKPAAAGGNGPTISLIKDRPSMLKRQYGDTRAARQSIDFIVSGHPVDDATTLAFRKAMANGAKVRKIIHQKDQLNSRHNKEWQAMGVETRFLPDLDMRLLIYDRKVTYFTSYDPKRPSHAFGVRFAYEPLALQMSDLFEQHWQKAKPV